DGFLPSEHPGRCGGLVSREATMADAHETRLVLRAQVGDRAALDELFQEVQGPLYRYLLGLAGEAHLAEDVLQEVFLRVHRKLGWLREAALFRPWLYRIATREALRRLRRERRWRQLVRDEEVLQSVEAPPAGGPIDDSLLDRLPGLLGQVSPASR